MGTFTLIPPMSLGNLNKAEKLSLLKRYMKLMPSGSDSESPDEISLLADSGVPALNISAGQVTRMNGIIDELTERRCKPPPRRRPRKCSKWRPIGIRRVTT